MRILLHGFADAAVSLRVAVDGLTSEHAGHEFSWLARRRYHAVLREAGFAGEIIDEEGLTDGSGVDHYDASEPWELGEELGTLLLLADREGSAANQYEADERVHRARLSVETMLSSRAFDGVVFASVPHALGSYLVHNWFARQGLPIAVIREGPAPHQYLICPDLTTRAADLLGVSGPHDEIPGPHPATEAFIERVRQPYAVAEPAYMRAQRQRGGIARRAFRRLRADALGALSPSSLKALTVSRARKRLRAQYQAMAEPLPRDATKFVALFLHLQPERTTVPEGGRWARQAAVAEVLARSLPAGWKLLVREHPSTFMIGAKLVRSPGFYELLARLPNTRLLSLDVSPYDAIDRAEVVATVTGTVGLEAAVRGVPAIAFGNAMYLGCEGIIDGAAAVRSGVNPIDMALEVRPSSSTVLSFLSAVDNSHVAWSPFLGRSSTEQIGRDQMVWSPLTRAIEVLEADPRRTSGS